MIGTERNAQELAKWLLQHCRVTYPLHLRFPGRPSQEIDGCLYSHPAPAEEGKWGIQLLDIPRTYIRRETKKKPGWPTTYVTHRVCFQLQEQHCLDLPRLKDIMAPRDLRTFAPLLDCDWYIAAYYVDDPTEMQPFGRNSILCPWTHEQPIDQHDSPYRRVRVSFEFEEKP